VLITRCTKFITPEGDAKPLDENTLKEIETIKNKWSSEGKRVILLARKTICREEMWESPTSARYEDEVMHHARSGLTFVGIVGIVDPPRDEIPSVVKILRRAGIRIFMVRISNINPK
jgi:sodium/potassium-transporting ATPase subunit alpha